MKALLLISVIFSTTYGNLRNKLLPRAMGNNLDFPVGLHSNETEIVGSYTSEDIVCSNETGFFCSDRSACIDLIYECDNFTDCYDGSDEHHSCSYFNCGDGFTLSSTFVCDGVSDCFNGHDEDREHGECNVIYCGNGSNVREVKDKQICDGVNDCKDDFNTDECNCTFTFVCANGRCVHLDDHCNDINNCGDGSDEINCNIVSCANGNQVSREELCDGIDQCGDSTDECNCSNTAMCNNNRCILETQKCNGVNECGDTSDECGCENTFFCSNGRCIWNNQVANGIDDCGDNSDEYEVIQSSTKTLTTETFSAHTTESRACQPIVSTNCDETNCLPFPKLCSIKANCSECFICTDGKKTIRFSSKCNDTRGCPDVYDACVCMESNNKKMKECPENQLIPGKFTTTLLSPTTKKTQETVTKDEGNKAGRYGISSAFWCVVVCYFYVFLW